MMDKDELIIKAGDLRNAVNGLALFTQDRFTSTNINVDDLSALNGLMAATKALVDAHTKDIIDSLDGRK